MQTTQDIGNRLRQAAIDSRLSMKQLAVRSGLHYASVWRFIREDGDLTLRSATKLCAVVGVELRPVSSKRKGKVRR